MKLVWWALIRVAYDILVHADSFLDKEGGSSKRQKKEGGGEEDADDDTDDDLNSDDDSKALQITIVCGIR